MSQQQPPNNSKEFKALQAKWNKKLAKSGFYDIEQEDGNLKSWHSFRFQAAGKDGSGAAKEEYYRLAGQFYHDYAFKNNFEKKVWYLNSEGFSAREIAKKTNKSRALVGRIINELTAEMLKHVNNR